jgi:cytochrome c-type biogenesis protein CcmH/NrfF
MQIWIYPTILLSLIIWRVRARRKKKKRKKQALNATENKIVSSGKGGLSIPISIH